MGDPADRDVAGADPWLSVKQVSDELSIHPSTVRLWLGEGRLAGVRVGGRKWRIRRSALDLMLGAGPATPAPDFAGSPAAIASPSQRAERAIKAEALSDDAQTALEQMLTADALWAAALDETTDPPPDLGFARRVRWVADAAEQEAAALRRADEVGLGWRTMPEARRMTLSYELRPQSKSRRGAAQLWERFDCAVERLGDALAGVAPGAVARGFSDLSEVARELADDIELLDSQSSRRQAG